MTVEFARLRIAKLRNETCYSRRNQQEGFINIKEDNYDAYECGQIGWLNVR